MTPVTSTICNINSHVLSRHQDDTFFLINFRIGIWVNSRCLKRHLQYIYLPWCQYNDFVIWHTVKFVFKTNLNLKWVWRQHAVQITIYFIITVQSYKNITSIILFNTPLNLYNYRSTFCWDILIKKSAILKKKKFFRQLNVDWVFFEKKTSIKYSEHRWISCINIESIFEMQS